LVNLTILSKTSLLFRIFRSKKSERKMMYLRRALDSAQYFIAWEKQLSIIKMQPENSADIRHKLSIICKHIQLMHNVLRYYGKTHTIYERLSKVNIKFCIFSQNCFFLKTIKQKNNKDMLMEKEITSSPNM